MQILNCRLALYIVVLLSFLLGSCEKSKHEPQKTRTLMVYLAGDNNLSTFMQKNINDMMSAWNEDFNGNIVVYFDANNAAPELFTFKVKGNKVIKQTIKEYEEMNSMDPEVLKMVLTEMKKKYPSDSYGLILGSHASGWMPVDDKSRAAFREPVLTRSFGLDGSMEMDTRKMAEAIPFGNNQLEFILFDACLMSSVEVLYDLRDKAKYVIASPAELPIRGFPYDKVMPYFWGEEQNLEKDLITVCDEFWKHYQEQGLTSKTFGTIALIKLEELDRLFDLTCEVLQGKKEYVANLSQNAVWCYPYVEYSNYYMFFDLGEYIKYMTAGREELYMEYRQFLDNKVVIHKRVTDPFYNTKIPEDKYSGIATYIPLSKWSSKTKAYDGFSWSRVYIAR